MSSKATQVTDRTTGAIPALRLRIPHTSIVRRYITRGFILWILVRIVTTVVAAVSDMIPPGDLTRWSPAGAVGVLGICAALGFVDVRFRGERALLGNLGIDDREVAAMFLIPATLGEFILAIVLPW
jgi:hypothetical protein